MVTGQLRIGRAGCDNAATAQLERTLVNFHQQHPGVQITINDTDSSQQLPGKVRAGTIDVAVVDLSAGQVGVNLVYHSLAVEPLVAISETHSAVTVSPTTAHQLGRAGRPGSTDRDGSGSGLRRQIDEAFDPAGVTRRIALAVSEPATVVRFVAMGLGSAVVPLSATVGRVNVTVQPIAEPVVSYPTGLINRRAETCTPTRCQRLTIGSPLVSGGSIRLSPA